MMAIACPVNGKYTLHATYKFRGYSSLNGGDYQDFLLHQKKKKERNLQWIPLDATFQLEEKYSKPFHFYSNFIGLLTIEVTYAQQRNQ